MQHLRLHRPKTPMNTYLKTPAQHCLDVTLSLSRLFEKYAIQHRRLSKPCRYPRRILNTEGYQKILIKSVSSQIHRRPVNIQNIKESHIRIQTMTVYRMT